VFLSKVNAKSKLDPFVPFILETLKKYPSLSAQRVYEMARERGYRGGISHLEAKSIYVGPSHC